jgi:hypothetical protein
MPVEHFEDKEKVLQFIFWRSKAVVAANSGDHQHQGSVCRFMAEGGPTLNR